MAHPEHASPPQKSAFSEVVRDIPWPKRALLLLGLLLPLFLAGLFGWSQRTQALDEARRTASRSVIALEQHAANVLDTHSLIVRQLDDLTRGKSWNQIGTDPLLKQNLTRLTRDFPQAAMVGMADANGRLWLNSVEGAGNQLSVVERDYFQAHREGRAHGLFVGEAFTSPLTGVHQFGISMARTSPSGAFDGVIFTTVPIDHFAAFWKQFTPSGGHVIPLLRSDGALIVRYPVLSSPQRLSPNGPFMTQLRLSPRGLYTAVSQVDGIERINAYSQIKDYPLYISFSVETAMVLHQWRQDMVVVAALGVLAALALAALWLAVAIQSHQERVLTRRWRESAGHLQREVSRREQAEDAMRQSQKMEAVGELAGGIAHDFNNLLAAIVSNLQLMRMRLGQGRSREVGRYVDAAEAVAGKASAMTQRLLSFSRRQTLAPAPLDVKERITSMHDLITRTVGPSIAVHIDFKPDACTTLCDPNQLDMALLNLAINARDAMPGGGELTISAARESLDALQAQARGLAPADYVTISVRDTGSGMAAKVIARAYEPFFTTKPMGQGTGLGLSMVYGFVTQSGGQVKITSAPDAGTEVTIYLPVHGGEILAAEPGPCAIQAARPSGKTSILLVDDQDAVREPLAELLTDLGYDVTQAADGAQGLEVLKSQHPVDLLVSDVGLPGHMNGRQLADAGRELRPGLKVMFITGYAEAAGADGMLGAGMEIMIKPFGLDDFAHKVSVMTDIGRKAVLVAVP